MSNDKPGNPLGKSNEAPLSMGFPNKNTGEGSRFLLQGIFLTQGLNSSLLHWRHTLYRWDNREWLDFNFNSVQFSCSVVSDSLRPHESQHARPPCPSPILGVHSNSCPLNQWYHPTISSSVVPFFSPLQYFPGSGYFPMSQFFHQVAKVSEFQLQHQ